MRIFVILTLYLFFVSCTNSDSQSVLSPSDFEKKMASMPGQLLDVRTADEFQIEHLQGAYNLDFYSENFDTEVSKFDKSKTYYLYCQRGGRSTSVREKLLKAGFLNVFELDGGISNWQKDGKPVEKGKLAPSTGLSMADFETLVKSQKIVLVDFSAKWCGPCKILSPMVEKIAKKRPNDLKVLVLDVDANQNVTQLNYIDEVPTLLWFKNGKQAMRMIGLRTEKEINDTIDQLLKD